MSYLSSSSSSASPLMTTGGLSGNSTISCNTTDQAIIKKLPATVGYLADYPGIIIQKPHVEGYTPPLF